MPQNGFHGLVGLAVAKWAAPHVPNASAPAFVSGVTLGAMLPDIDMYPTAIVVLLGRPDLIYITHRTATHSLALMAALIVAGAIAGRRFPTVGWALHGLGLGVATHILLDLFFWFAPLDLFWPLSRLPVGRPMMPIVNLWSGSRIPPILLNVREAFEFAAFGLLLAALRRIGLGTHCGADQLAGIKKWEIAAWVAFVIAIAGAIIFRSKPSLQNLLVTTPCLLAFLPFCWAATFRMRDCIVAWCRIGAVKKHDGRGFHS